MRKDDRKHRQSASSPSAQQSSAGQIESLEARRLLSAAAALPANGVLSVVGTQGNDTIEIEQTGSNVSVLLDGSPLNIMRGRRSLGTAVNTALYPIKRIDVQGLAGNDIITYDATVTIPGIIVEGNGSDQMISPGIANLTLRAGAGEDILTLGDGNYSVSLGRGDDSVTTGNGNSVIKAVAPTAGTNVDNFNIGNGTNTLTYHGGIDNVTFGTGDDRLIASGDAVSGITVPAGAGPDFIDNPYSGNIDLTGTTGNNVVRIGGSSVLELGNGNNLALAEGKAGFDYITGGTGSDTIVALQGNDTIDGTAGNDDVLVSARLTNVIVGSSTSAIYGPATLSGNIDSNAVNSAAYFPTIPQIIRRRLPAWEAQT